jgi:hypothetical protein
MEMMLGDKSIARMAGLSTALTWDAIVQKLDTGYLPFYTHLTG